MKRDTNKIVILLIAFATIMGIAIADTATTQVTITNSPPVASSVAVDPGNLNGGEIALDPNVTTELGITATVTDNNGCTEITNVTGDIFRTNISGGGSAAADGRNSYDVVCTVEAGTCGGAGDLAALYNCNITAQWYMDPTDVGSFNDGTNWTINITPYDGAGAGTAGANTYEVQTLTAFSLETLNVNFGSLALGANTGLTNSNISLANHGNENIDVSLSGYAETPGDNYSMNCTIGNIPVANLEYNNGTFNYGSGTDMTGASTEIDFDLDRGSDSTQRPEQDISLGFGIPTDGVGGACTGNIVVVAVSDPLAD